MQHEGRGPQLKRRRLAECQFRALFALILLSVSSLGQQPAPAPEWPDGVSHIQQREQWFYGQRAFPFDRIPPGARLKALEQRRQMQTQEQAAAAAAGLSAAAVSSTSWTALGPQPVSTPFTYGNVSGRVAALAVDPGNSSVVYLGAAQGGVWKTTNGGTSWTALTDTQPSLSIGSIAIDPINTSIIYVGTGEQNFAQDAYYGAGILKSTDGGSTWTQLTGSAGVTFVPPSSDPTYIGGIAVEPGNSNVVLAAVGLAGRVNFGQTGYVARSTDGGSTWTKVLAASGNNSANAVFFDPTNGSVAYAAIQGKGVYSSADGGATWAFLPGTGSNLFPTTNLGRIALAIAPSSTSTLYAAVGSSSPFGDLMGIWKTTDKGANWVKLTSAPDYCSSFHQCWYDNVITVDPVNANVVYAGGEENTDTYQTLDGGSTWKLVQNGIHPDTHAFAFSSDGSVLYVGNDGGVWKTTTPASSTITWTNLNATLETAQFYSNLGIHPTNAQIIFGGTQDNGVEASTSTLTWNEVDCGDGSSAAIDYNHTSTVYDNCNQIAIDKSTSGGSFGSFSSAQSGITTSDRVAFIPPLVMDPVNPSILYFGTFRIYQTTNGASSWTAISPDLTGGDAGFFGNIASIAVAKSNNNVVYVGMNDGKFQVSTNALSGASSTWTDRSTGLPGRAVTAIAIDPTNAANVFAATSGFGTGHVFQSTNSGATWTNISGNLPNIPVNGIVFDPDIANTLYIGTDVGVMKTSDGGTTWSTLVTGLPNVAVLALGLQESNRLLFAGTHGRGVWELSIPAVALTSTTTAVASNANPSVFGQSVTFTATVAPTSGSGTPTGTVTFKDGSTTLGTGTLSSGSATLNTSSLTVGSHSITAIYGGDSSFSASTSSALSQVVNTDATTTTAMSSANPSVFGQSITFTAVVSANAPGSGVPTGTVTFKDGSTTLGTGTLSAGSATFNTAALAVGSHSITAVYGGNSNFSSGTSSAITQTVNLASTASAVASSANPSVFGQFVTFTATVSAVAPGAGTPAGTVTFKDGATTLGTNTLSGGTASFATSTLILGGHSITAVYGGSGSFAASTSATLTQTVNMAGTTTVVVSSANPSVFGQSVTFTATVSPAAPASGTPTGTVTFKDGTTTLGTGTLSAGAATFNTAALAVGSHSITAVYGADSNYSGSTSTALSQVVNAASTTTAVASSANPSVFGQSVTFTATVSAVAPGAGAPSGTVTFKDGATTLGTGPLSSGSATFATSSLAAGSHSITAVYGGNTSFATSTSSILTQTVNAATTTTADVSSTNPSVIGQSVTFTATVTAVAPGVGTPTGTVTFKDGTTTLGAGTLSSGSATFATTALAVGSHSITAVYGGSSSFSGSTSSTVTQVVNQGGSTAAVVSSLNPSSTGQSVTFTATISAVAPAAGVPNGTVTFKDGATTLGTGTLSAGHAAFSTSSLTAGTHSITAVYGGDTNFTASTSAAITQTVSQTITTTTTVLASSKNPSVFGQSVTFTATVTPTSGTGTPTGTVTFKDGTTTLGTGALSSGVATFTSSALIVGSHSITAAYSGDSNFGSSTSSTLTQSVSMAATTTSIVSSVNPSVFGQSVLFTATVNAVAPGVGTPTGIVTFKDGTTTLGTQTLSGGVASLSTSSLAAAGHNITVSYGGDTDFSASTSATLTQTVNAASTTTTVVTTVNPSVFGQSVTFTATVAAVAPGAGSPGGTVTFKDGTTTLGTGTLSSGTAAFTTAGLAVGSHSVTAVYAGNTNFAGSTSSSITQTVNQANTSVSLGSSWNPAQAGTAVQFVATVAAIAPGAGTPTGTVTFKDNGTTIGTGTLSGGSATFSTTSLSAGTHPITAVYSGSASFGGSTSNTVSQSVTAQTINITLQLSHTPLHPVAIGGTLVETITITNSASSTSSTTVSPTVSVTGNFVVTSAGGCSGTGPITCAASLLNPGQSTTIQITLTPLLGHDISIHVDLGNNSQSDAISVVFKPQAR